MGPSGCTCVLEQSVYWIAYIVGAGSTHSLVLTVAAQAKNLDPSSPSAEGLEAPESLVLVLHKVKDYGGCVSGGGPQPCTLRGRGPAHLAHCFLHHPFRLLTIGEARFP